MAKVIIQLSKKELYKDFADYLYHRVRHKNPMLRQRDCLYIAKYTPIGCILNNKSYLDTFKENIELPTNKRFSIKLTVID